jgi:hypothetical protein
VALAPAPGAPAAAAHHHHQGPVIHYLAHPVGPVPIPTVNNNKVYLICLSNAHTHCAGFNTDATIVVVGTLILVACQFVNCPQIFKVIVKGKGKHTKITAEDEGSYHHDNTNFVHACLGANPTASDGNDQVYFSTPQACFGPLQQSWKLRSEPGKYRYHLLNEQAEHEHRVYAMANLNLRNGAYFYVKPNTQPGLWTTWSFYEVGHCHPC